MVLVKDVMTRELISVTEDLSIDVAIDRMIEQNVSGLPVVDEHGCLVGLLSEFDVLHLYGQDNNEETRYQPCSKCMTRDVRTIDQDASLEVAARIFQVASLRRLIVVDGPKKKLVGVLSRRDIVRCIRDGRMKLGRTK